MKSDDLISRQAAIEALDGKITLTGRANVIAVQEYINQVKDRLERLPSKQPKRGKWIKISPANIYECSECGKSVMTNDICAYDFCHGCGAEMEVTT